MTPFMLRVAAVLRQSTPDRAAPDRAAPDVVAPDVTAPDRAGPDATVPALLTRRSAPTAVNVGADRQVAVRALAEQLVCEANAVLTGDGDQLTLTDEISVDELAFSVRYRGSSARVSTRFAGGAAYGRLIGAGADATEPRELTGPDALPDLLVRLLVTAGPDRRDR